MWQDRRTAARCDELRDQGHLELVRSTTGLVLDPYFSGTKLEWLLGPGGVTAGPDLAFGTIDSWLLWNLTGGSAAAGAVHATDVVQRQSHPPVRHPHLHLVRASVRPAGDPRTCCPRCTRRRDASGSPRSGLAGIGAGIPVSGIAGDQQAALFGQACFEPGMTKNTYGTGSFVLMNVGETSPTRSRGC